MNAQRKLVSPEGHYLGVISIPLEWDEHIRRSGRFEFQLLDKYPPVPGDTVTVKTAAIQLSYTSRYPNGVVLRYITVEEFEKITECSFAPSAAYVRRAIEQEIF